MEIMTVNVPVCLRVLERKERWREIETEKGGREEGEEEEERLHTCSNIISMDSVTFWMQYDF